MREFWVSSGHHLTRRNQRGELAVTDELLLAYLARPELMPPPEACNAERQLHARLRAEPRRPVLPAEIDRLAEADARENWRIALAFRNALLAAGSVEAAYLALIQPDASHTPALLLDQLVHLILRNALDGCEDPYVLRAAELFFRPQRVSTHDGAVLLGDAEAVAALPHSPLAAMLGREPAPELDVLNAESGWTYWSRSDAFTMALNIGSDPRAREALARVIEIWIRHLLSLEAEVQPQARIEDPDWRWFVSLDAEATRIGNALWRGETLPPEAASRLLALFSLRFRSSKKIDPRVAQSPLPVLLAMNPERMVRIKPQNLIAGLPLTAGMTVA
jgi:hypothetical protein